MKMKSEFKPLNLFTSSSTNFRMIKSSPSFSIFMILCLTQLLKLRMKLAMFYVNYLLSLEKIRKSFNSYLNWRNYVMMTTLMSESAIWRLSVNMSKYWESTNYPILFLLWRVHVLIQNGGLDCKPSKLS